MAFPPRAFVPTSTALFVLATFPVATAQTGGAASPAIMRSHFEHVTAVHEAVIRGDLDAARKTASELATRELPGPANTAAIRDELKSLAGRVAAATDLHTAAMATGSMLAACGECHRVAGVMPAPALPVRPVVGRTVGHMLDHQRAADQLLQGLVIPSSSLWNQGAQALRRAPLESGQLPKDPKLTSEATAGEQRIHELADQAAGASETSARAGVYGEMLTACANCHALHKGVWGPSRH